MATRVPLLDDFAPQFDSGRLYTACIFERAAVVPRVQMLTAETDEEAIAEVRSSNLFMMRELWDRHRLVAIIRPKSPDSD